MAEHLSTIGNVTMLDATFAVYAYSREWGALIITVGDMTYSVSITTAKMRALAADLLTAADDAVPSHHLDEVSS